MKLNRRKEGKKRSPANGRAADLHPRGALRPARRRNSRSAPKYAISVEPEDAKSPNDVKRILLTQLRIPMVCEEKPCRRWQRCVGIVRLPYGGDGIACWERHHDKLVPIWQRYVIPRIRESLAAEDPANQNTYSRTTKDKSLP